MSVLRASGPLDRMPLPPWNPGRVSNTPGDTQYRPGALNLMDTGGGPVPGGDQFLIQQDGFAILQQSGSHILWS